MLRFTLTILALVIFGTSTAEASDFGAPCVGLDCIRPHPAPAIDPKIELIRKALAEQGREHPLFGTRRAARSDDGPTDRIAMTLRFWRPLDPIEIAFAEGHGVEWFRRLDGELVRVGLVYGAVVPFDSLPALQTLPLRRLEAAWRPESPRPLDTTSAEVGAEQAHRLPPDGIDGRGRTIVDVDSSVDVLHPHLFRADGGRYAWLDVDENGVFDPGVDAVDLDGDGKKDSREVLFVLDAATVDFSDEATVDGDDSELQPRRDWLFADLNGDRKRNVGPEAGFTEEDPAFGEPLFVVDDIDRDGVLEAGEPIFMLGTSKVARLVTESDTYVRGTNLIDASQDPSVRSSFHGTAVSSILVGGQSGFHDRVGLAPGAELVLYSTRGLTSTSLDETLELRAIDDAVELGADVVLHEWTNPYTAQHDGSSNLNAAMDAARAEGVVQVTPVGNMNLSGKHLVQALDSSGTTTLQFDVPAEGWPGRDGERLPYSTAFVSLFWQNDDDLAVTLVSPSGEELVLVPGGEIQQFPGAAGTRTLSSFERSERGTAHFFTTLYVEDDVALSAGRWSLRLDGGTQSGQVWGRVADFHSGWGVGISWAEPTQDRGTAVYPSTADSAVGVGAYAGRVAGARPVGALRDYSGRGPRIDGAQNVDITAPDDPIAALAASPFFLELGFGRSWFTSFGGTSGSGAHVAAGIALLRQQSPSRSPAEIEMLVADAARTEPLVPPPDELPDEAWGEGKLDLFGALFGGPAPENQRPSIGAKVTDEGIDASESADPDGDPIEFRFDVDNDGNPERDWSPSALFIGELPESGFARVDVRDSGGLQIGELLVLEPSSMPDADAGTGPDAGSRPPGVLTGDGCSKAGGSPPASLIPLIALLGLIGLRRSF